MLLNNTIYFLTLLIMQTLLFKNYVLKESAFHLHRQCNRQTEGLTKSNTPMESHPRVESLYIVCHLLTYAFNADS